MRVYSTDNGWGLFKDGSGEGRGQTHRYRRTYTWNSRNQLVSSVDSNYSTSYVYGQDGQRSNKYTQGSETLYFNKMWTLHTDNGNSVYGGQYAKNVYLGETRIVTKLARADQKTAHEEMYKQYYYHSDHLGSATMISDWEGKEYQRIEYTPYGETWVEKTNNSGSEFLPYKFTGKEVDQETGLYYYGARYLDPKYSMWISTDPALGEYIPEMGKGNAKDSGSLPGMGGVYNHINFHLYHYAGNNPVRFVDPDGRYSVKQLKDDVLSTLYHISNFDFGSDFSRFVELEWTNKNYLLAAGWELACALEMTLDVLLCYKGAQVIGALSEALPMLYGTIAALNPNSTVVLGRYSEGSCGGYTKMAEKLGANYFQLPDKMFKLLEKINIGNSNLGKIINEKWINGVINSNARILLNFDPENAPEGSAYAMEVIKLKENEYKFVKTCVEGIECWEATK